MDSLILTPTEIREQLAEFYGIGQYGWEIAEANYIAKAQAQKIGKRLLKMSQVHSTASLHGLSPYDIEQWIRRGGVEL